MTGQGWNSYSSKYDDESQTTTFIYNDAGILEKQIVDDKSFGPHECIMDSEGRHVVKLLQLNSKGEVHNTREYEYEIEDGVVRKCTEYNPAWRKPSVEIYDEYGNLIRYDAPYGDLYEYTNTYDDNGRLIKVVDQDQNKTILTYDKYGNLISTESDDGTISTYLYEYRYTGNN